MDYDKVTNYILNLKRFGDIKLGFERVDYLLEGLGNPEKKLKCVHVGGTTGKGSTAAMVSSVLSSAGYRVGTYTSPHLSDYTERIVIRGQKIPKDEVVRLFEQMVPLADRMEKEKNETPTFFEFTTALALKYFYDKNVDIAVMEVGLGGRLDATNVINAVVSIITNIGLEHTDILGDTKEKIAYEKAGIIKNNSSLVTAADAETRKMFQKICNERHTNIYCVGPESDIKVSRVGSDEESQTFDVDGFGEHYGNVECGLIGKHQLLNAGCAFGAIHVMNQHGFKISEEAFRKGLRDVVWPGRLEIVQRNPRIVLDCAKDPLGMRALKDAITDIFEYDKLITIIGISSDKKISLMLDEIVPISDMVITTKHHVSGRAFDPVELATMVSKYGKSATVTKDINEALDIALRSAGDNDIICITGSLFLVGEARERWHSEVVIWGREMNETRKEKKVRDTSS